MPLSIPIRFVRSAALVAVAILAASGCNRDGRPQTESEKHLQPLAILYGKYVSRHRGVGPKDEADFKAFIHSLSPEEVQGAGADPANIDQLFVSPRDGQPYGIAAKIQGGAVGPQGQAPLVIWEQTGRGGKRYVADSLGKIEELDEATFNQRRANPPVKK